MAVVTEAVDFLVDFQAATAAAARECSWPPVAGFRAAVFRVGVFPGAAAISAAVAATAIVAVVTAVEIEGGKFSQRLY